MLTSTKNLDLCLLLKYGGRGREVGSISEAQRLLVLLIWQIFLRDLGQCIRVYQQVYQRCISGLVCVYVLV